MFAYLAVFVGILIVLLWLFQTVFLDSFYRTIKTASIKSTAEQIAHNIDHPNLSERLETISRQNEVCIRIVDSNYNDLYNSEIMPNCFIHHMTNLGLQELYQKAKANRNSALQQFSAGEFMKNFFAGDRNVGREVMPPPFRRDNQSMIYAKIATAADGSERMILLNAMISPVNATVDTLRIQLICITVIFLILAMLSRLFYFNADFKADCKNQLLC